MLIPTDRIELVQLLRDLANAIEKGETEYRGCQVTHAMDRTILPNGEYGDVSDMVFDLRVSAESKVTYGLFKQFAQVRHYAPRMPS